MTRGALAVRQRSSMQTSVDPNRASARAFARQRSLPATGLPARRDDRRGWGLLSALLHVLVVALLITKDWSPSGRRALVAPDRQVEAVAGSVGQAE